MGMWKRVPIGPCSFISPFNFPLNLAAHKIAPAIAMGCPFVMKPASLTPLGAIIMGEVLAECDILPEGAFSILPATRDGADLFTTDARLKLLSFTGSPGVGWDLKAKAGKKKVVLELGGNAAVIVDKDADLDHALARIIFGAFYQSGQSMLQATLLENVDRSADAYREEAFGPLAILSRFTDWDAALAEINDSKFGLQAGLFTRDLHKVLEAWDHLDVGGIVVNDVSSYRVDNMPYGGVKDSGLGREGIRFAMEDMSEIRNLVIRRT